MTNSVPPAAPTEVEQLRGDASGARLLITTAVVKAVVERALATAQAADIEAATKQQLHAARSRHFVAALGTELHHLYADDPDVRAFTKHDERNRRDFGMNELLYDATICRTSTVKSARTAKPLHYVSAPLWHVESELAENSRQALFDFNKLVLGAAPLNLFVGPLVSEPDRFIDVLRAPAACCKGRVFVALIPHPRDWGAEPADIACTELSATRRRR